MTYKNTLPSARDLALGKDFFNLKKSLPSANDLALDKDFFTECPNQYKFCAHRVHRPKPRTRTINLLVGVRNIDTYIFQCLGNEF
jgi:hypothetical protein